MSEMYWIADVMALVRHGSGVRVDEARASQAVQTLVGQRAGGIW